MNVFVVSYIASICSLV